MFMGPIVPRYPDVPKASCIATYREGYAQLPQSTTADKINQHGMNYVYFNQEDFKPVELLSQIHDSIVFQIPLSIPWKQHADIILKIKKSLETPMYWRDTKIIVPADVAIGFNMCKEEMKEFKSKDVPDDIVMVADKLEGVYNELRK